MKIATIILAAGMGTRMRSSTPKVLHCLGGKPLIWYSLQAADEVDSELTVVVVGHKAEDVQKEVGDTTRCVVQEPQLGTGHAVQTAQRLTEGSTDLVVVTYADMPLLTGETMRTLIETQKANDGPVTMLTMVLDDSHGFGRVIRFEDGSVQEIVEEAQATPEQLAVRELNVGVYCFDSRWLWDALERVPLSPEGEYYLTDTVGIATGDKLKVQAQVLQDPSEAIGINTRVHLAEAEAVLRRRINTSWMLEGVTLVDPDAVYIEPDVSIGRDTIIHPNTILRGATEIGEECVIGPNSVLDGCKVGSRCKILASVLDAGAVVGDGVVMGPFCHLRQGAHLAEGVRMGNFGEVKNSYLARGVQMGHFSYIGDARIGRNANIGAGTVTCNYDGVDKHPTEIGEDALIGSATMLVAPVKIGDRAQTGAGSVVTRDVPPDTVVVGVPARPKKKTGSEQ